MLIFVKYLLILSSVLPQIRATKWLLDQPGFDNPDAWISEELPCSLEDVVFPSSFQAVLPLPKQVDIKGMILPRNGAILFNKDSTINLGGEKTSRDCENGRRRQAFLKSPKSLKWYDPKSWRSNSVPNGAITEMEKVPCSYESVIIPTSGPLSIDLENVANLRMGQLSIAGSLLSKNYLEKLNPKRAWLIFK